ncbi:MAG: nucleotidyltransferase family protein [Bacteroidales bacterium]|nr:nucleotidyltransferase family protein [Bacteroidales bacterium]
MEKYIIQPSYSIKRTIEELDLAASKVLFVVDDQEYLIGAVSDGDIRRAILKGISLEKPVCEIMNENPISFYEDYSLETVKETLLQHKIEAVPIVDKRNRVVEILFWDEIFKEKGTNYSQIDLPVVIMAGGKGTRLDPFTRILPKPLIPIGEKTIIEVIMDEFVKYGMKDFYISINHKGRMIKAYFKDQESDYNLQYIYEDKPLGTAGALRALHGKIDTPFFVSNCDIIIKDDYTKIYNFHKKEGFSLTLVGSMQHHTIPYGVCEIDISGALKKIDEKPEQDIIVNAGMYLLNPEVLKLIPPNEFFHITDLIEKLQENGYKIGVYPITEKSWIDIGQWEEYKKSTKIFNNI